MPISSPSVRSALVVSALLALAGSQAHAAMILESSSATISHTNGPGGPTFLRGYDGLPAYTSSFFQYNSATTGALINAGSTSTARIGLGIVNNPNYLGIGFATGSNLTQRGNLNPSGATAAALRCDFTASWINDSATPYGTNLQAGASFGVVGNVPTSATNSAFVTLIIVANFYLQPPTNPQIQLRSAINPVPFFSRTTSGNFAFSRSDLVNAVPATIPAGYRLYISGYLEYRVHNDDDEVFIESSGPTGALGGDDPSQFFIPSPGAAGLLALTGAFALRRRRSV